MTVASLLFFHGRLCAAEMAEETEGLRRIGGGAKRAPKAQKEVETMCSKLFLLSVGREATKEELRRIMKASRGG